MTNAVVLTGGGGGVSKSLCSSLYLMYGIVFVNIYFTPKLLEAEYFFVCFFLLNNLQ